MSLSESTDGWISNYELARLKADVHLHVALD